RFRETRQQRKVQRQQESKARAAAKADRVEKWRQTNVAFLGDGVSGSLGQHQSQPERLKAAGLPLLSTPNDVAEALHIDIPELRWLAFHTEAARTSHYTQFSIPKRSGGTRLISAPKPKTARAQRWILNNIVKRLPVEPPAHGFVSNRSIVTNAKAHIGQKLVFNVDLEAFFPTITFCRVRGLLQSIGYAPSVSTVLALLCTECPRTRLQYGDDVYFAAVGERALPQGACTSPALSNAIARRLDRRLMGLCKKASWRYTRYADDLTFSSNAPETLAGVWASIRHIIKDEGFRINRKKVRIQRSGRCQKVTGIVVNDKLGLPRTEVRRLRAIIHNAENSGLASQNRDNDPKF
ncbi:MAG: reverse transcriptase family protein, partial [Myxococcota bacterium]